MSESEVLNALQEIELVMQDSGIHVTEYDGIVIESSSRDDKVCVYSTELDERWDIHLTMGSIDPEAYEALENVDLEEILIRLELGICGEV